LGCGFFFNPRRPFSLYVPSPHALSRAFFLGGGWLKLGSLIGDGAESGGGGDLGTGFDAERWPGIRQCLLRGMKK